MADFSAFGLPAKEPRGLGAADVIATRAGAPARIEKPFVGAERLGAGVMPPCRLLLRANPDLEPPDEELELPLSGPTMKPSLHKKRSCLCEVDYHLFICYARAS